MMPFEKENDLVDTDPIIQCGDQKNGPPNGRSWL